MAAVILKMEGPPVAGVAALTERVIELEDEVSSARAIILGLISLAASAVSLGLLEPSAVAAAMCGTG